MPKINNSNLSNEEHKELKLKLGQLQEEISKAFLLVNSDLSNGFKSIIIHEIILRGVAKISMIFPCYISCQEPWYWCYKSDSQLI